MWTTVVLLLCSNVFMTFAWYAHLRNLHDKACYIAALASWGIALCEYLLQLPGTSAGCLCVQNQSVRMGYIFLSS